MAKKARKRKAPLRRAGKKKATRRRKAPVTMGSAHMDAAGFRPPPFAPDKMWCWLSQHVGQPATASGIGGCYVGTIQAAWTDGVLLCTSDGMLVALGLANLELMIGSTSGEAAQAAMPEPPTRGIPPEEDF